MTNHSSNRYRPASRLTPHIIFILTVIATAAMIYGPLTGLFESPLYRNYHSLIPFIPLISLYLLYLKRKVLLEQQSFSWAGGVIMLIAGIASYGTAFSFGKVLEANDYGTITIFSALLVLWGGFLLAYGMKNFVALLFPLLFLVFMIPVPFQIMEAIILFLQKGSTEFTNLLFALSPTPFFRDEFIFHLPGISVEVAPQCSGIRSALALFITCLLAGYLFLDSWWNRAFLVAVSIPVTMLKNGIRIATLTLLGVHVDPRILQSSLHREGGIPFFILALLMMAPILFFLVRVERKRKGSPEG